MQTATNVRVWSRQWRALAPAAVCISLLAGPAAAQQPFYQGKTVTIVVGFTAGGGYDAYARLMSRFMGPHIAGAPTIVVQNMPGAGSLTAVRHLDGAVPKDGTVITTFNQGIITESQTDPEKVKTRLSDYAWIGSVTRDFRICYVWKASGITGWSDIAAGKELILGGTAVGAGNYTNGAVLRNLFGLKVRQILGFPGSTEQRLAIERGELNSDCGAWSSVSPDWIKNDRIIPFVSFSPERTPDMPADVPLLASFATTDEQRQIVKLLISPDNVARPYIMSREVPPERLEILRQAFDATVQDPAFVAEAKRLDLPVNPITGAAAQKLLAEIYSASPELVGKLKAAIQ